MDEVRTAWNEAADKLDGLGLKLKLHYEQQQGADRESAQSEVQGALQRLSDAVQTAFEALGAAAKDEAVRDDAKQVGQSLTHALRASFTEVSGEVRSALKRRAEDGTTAEPTDPADTGSVPDDAPTGDGTAPPAG